MILSAILLATEVIATPVQDSLQEVKVIADRNIRVSGTDTLTIANSISITDALSSVPGLYITDYGGAAGAKNVSLRGLGSAHSEIYLDGVRVWNVQQGQVDLGMLDLGNYGSVVIDYARNSVSFSTSRPEPGRKGFVKLRGGSFGSYEGEGRLDFTLSRKLCLSASAGAVSSDGDFPLEDGGRRRNNDIRRAHAGIDVRGIMESGDWHVKTYLNASERGTPGAVEWPSTDRQKDLESFVQGALRKQFTPAYSLHLSAKASLDNLEYLSSWGNNRYCQKELQLSSAHKFNISRWFDVSMSADAVIDRLDSDLYDGMRTSALASAAASFHTGRFKANLALEYKGIFDSGSSGRNVLSPSADFRWELIKSLDITGFVRRACREPSFNELYYPGYGNPDLRGEDACLSGLGLEFKTTGPDGSRFELGADAFRNSLRDKIVSAPTALDPSIWLPYNIGSVQMGGADLKASGRFTQGRRLKCRLNARYGYLDAVDTTPGSATCGQQIPFISKHTLCLGAEAMLEGWSADLRLCRRSGRYDAYGHVPDYHTLDLTLGKELKLRTGAAVSLKLFGRNLTGCRYELTGGYPMPGRSLLVETEIKF